MLIATKVSLLHGGIGCRRVLPADPYMRAIQQENVQVHFAAAAEFTETSIIDSQGNAHEVDAIVCATGNPPSLHIRVSLMKIPGFDTEHRCRFPIKGRNGIDLATQWNSHPEAYLGLAVPNVNIIHCVHCPELIQRRCPTSSRSWAQHGLSITAQ